MLGISRQSESAVNRRECLVTLLPITTHAAQRRRRLHGPVMPGLRRLRLGVGTGASAGYPPGYGQSLRHHGRPLSHTAHIGQLNITLLPRYAKACER